jgi:hypothetical protein
VLRPGGRLALLEVIGDGPRAPIPVPLGRRPGTELRHFRRRDAALLTAAGFAIESWRVGVDAQTAIVAATVDTERMAPGPRSRLEVLMPDYTARMAGLASKVEAGRISLLLAVMTKEDRTTTPPTQSAR